MKYRILFPKMLWRFYQQNTNEFWGLDFVKLLQICLICWLTSGQDETGRSVLNSPAILSLCKLGGTNTHTQTSQRRGEQSWGFLFDTEF